MSYLTRLTQQTGLVPAQPAPVGQAAQSAQPGLPPTEELVAPASSDLSQTVEPPTPPTNLSPGTAALNSGPSLSIFLASQPPPQEPASLGFSRPAASLRPDPNLSDQGSPAPKNSASKDWLGTDSGLTVQFPAPEATTDAFQPLILPGVTVQSPKTPPEAASPSAYLQTLQAVRDWVSAAKAVPRSGLNQKPTAPATVQVINPAELAISPIDRPNLGPASSSWDGVANPIPFATSTAEPAAMISIGSIQVTVEGPAAPPAPAPVRLRSPHRPPARLSRHYLRLR